MQSLSPQVEALLQIFSKNVNAMMGRNVIGVSGSVDDMTKQLTEIIRKRIKIESDTNFVDRVVNGSVQRKTNYTQFLADILSSVESKVQSLVAAKQRQADSDIQQITQSLNTFEEESMNKLQNAAV